jgi:tyrosine-protein phosphatase YwqE
MKRRNFTMSRSGIVNVRMVITEEKILSNIAKVQRLIDPNSKKQIVQLEDDAFFKDLIESIKTYLIEYPKKKNFPKSVYKAAYGLVEFATNEFEENTKQSAFDKNEKGFSFLPSKYTLSFKFNSFIYF